MIEFWPKTCAFDCEWVPCVDTARRLLDLSDDVSDADAIEAVRRYASPKYASGEETNPPFLKYVLSRIVSIAAVFRVCEPGKPPHLELFSAGADECSEAEMIRVFLERVAAGRFQLWGFNSSRSDLPILLQRAIAQEVECPRFAARPSKSWDMHQMDILQIMTNGGWGNAVPKLDEVAAACGIPGKLGVTGEDVEPLFRAGRVRDIVAYNQLDALTTHLLMLRVGLYAGHLDRKNYRSEVEAVERLLEEQKAQGNPAAIEFDAAWQRQKHAPRPLPAPAQPLPQPQSQALLPVRSPVALPAEWPSFLDEFKARYGIYTQAALRGVKSVESTGSSLVLYFAARFQHDMMSQKENRRRMEEVASAIWSGVSTVECRLEADRRPSQPLDGTGDYDDEP